MLQVIVNSLRACSHSSIAAAASLNCHASAALSCAISRSLSSRWHCNLTRGFAACSKLRPKFTGGKIKTSGGWKERFKLTGRPILICQTRDLSWSQMPLPCWQRHQAIMSPMEVMHNMHLVRSIRHLSTIVFAQPQGERRGGDTKVFLTSGIKANI